MVRVGGMDYVCDPKAGAGQRISSMTLDDGRAVDPAATYKVAGWATVGSQAPGPPIWDVVAEYLRDARVAEVRKLNTPVLRGVSGNPGIADYAGRLEG
jgi:sulfur-oxidizing protein SoxB